MHKGAHVDAVPSKLIDAKHRKISVKAWRSGRRRLQ
jgi:hypothetical protein